MKGRRVLEAAKLICERIDLAAGRAHVARVVLAVALPATALASTACYAAPFEPIVSEPSDACYWERDDDGDGLVGCDDPDCWEWMQCNVESRCDDGLDNDEDGLVDCEDPDCEDDASC